MECWAHAASTRRRLKSELSSTGNTTNNNSGGSSSSRKSSSAISQSSDSSICSVNLFIDTMIQRNLPQDRTPHVCVVGAGMAGLKAADVLTRHGIKVTILEGRDRIGGRIHQSSHLGHLADLGPNWIHGAEGNPIVGLAKETNSTCFEPPLDVPTWLYDEKGVLVDSEISQERIGIVWELVEDAYKYSRENAESISSDQSLLDFFKIRLKEQNRNDEAIQQMLEIARVWSDVIGEPVERQSLKFFWLEECLDGGNVFLASTYKAVLDAVAKPVLAKVDLQLNTIVKAITAATAPHGSNYVTLTTATGKMLTFDEVILTVPLGWLKQNLSAFTPLLPPRLTKAINNISYGRLEKVYLTFPKAWWFNPSTPKANAFIVQYLSPSYSLSTNPSRWYIGCVSLSSLPAPHAHPTLLFYINGPCAAHVTSLVADFSPTSDIRLARLTNFFKPYFSLLPNYDPTSPACAPKAALATNWIGDDLAGNGSYSNFLTSRPEEKIELDKDIDTLRYGLPEKGIWFAGEAMAPFVALGTVTGAFWSGEAVGERVATIYGFGSGDTEVEG